MSDYVWIAASVVAALPVALIFAAAVAEATKTAYYRWTYRRIPGPTPSIIGGNLMAIKKAGGAAFALEQWHAQYGPIFKVFALGKMYVVAAEPTLARLAMGKMANRPKGFLPVFHLAYGKRKRVIFSTLVAAGDKLWRALRNAWQPAFGVASLQGYAPTMQACADELCEVLSQAQQQTAGGSAAAAGQLMPSSSPAAGSSISGGGGGSCPFKRSTADKKASAGKQGDSVSGCPMMRTTAGKEQSAVAAAAQVAQQSAVAAAQEGVVSMDDLFKKLTFNVLGTCGYGLKFNAFADDNCPVENASTKQLTKACQDMGTQSLTSTKWIFVYSALPALTPIIVQLARFFPDEPLARVNKGMDDLFHYADLLVKNWRKQASTPGGVPETTAIGTPAKDSFLARSLKAQDQMIKEGILPKSDAVDDSTIAAQSSNFIFGGSETSSASMGFITALVSANPVVEKKLMQELEAHGLDKTVTLEDLPKFTYLDAVFNEALRLLPPIHTLTRDLASGIESITLAGHRLPAGVSVMLPIYTLHRDPKVWGPRAAEFVPERWLPKDHPDAVSDPVDMNSYMPFGAGARMCPGFKFAIQEVKLTLITLFQKFSFELAPGQSAYEVVCGAGLAPKGGLMMKPIPRVHNKIHNKSKVESKVESKVVASASKVEPALESKVLVASKVDSKSKESKVEASAVAEIKVVSKVVVPSKAVESKVATPKMADLKSKVVVDGDDDIWSNDICCERSNSVSAA